MSTNVFENITNLRQFPFIVESSLIAFSLSGSIMLPTLLHQLRILCGKSLLSRQNRYRNNVISFIFLFFISHRFIFMFPIVIRYMSSNLFYKLYITLSGNNSGIPFFLILKEYVSPCPLGRHSSKSTVMIFCSISTSNCPTFIIRKTKCFRILERNAKISKTKRNFSRLYPTPQKFKKIDRLRRNEIHLKAVRTSS